MIHNIPSLERLLKMLQKIPYLASRNIYRVATFFLESKTEQIDMMCTILQQAKVRVRHCNVCFYWHEIDRLCSFCSSATRDKTVICVVESWQDLIAIEKTQGFTGVYHILKGVICPLEGIGPDNLTIVPLKERVEKGGISEIILALNQTPEGEATNAYINRILKHTGVMISCLARGVPVGSLIESMDRVTVYKALSERRPF
jgi:recombination protein RecR